MADRHLSIFPFYTHALSSMQKSVLVNTKNIFWERGTIDETAFSRELYKLATAGDRQKYIQFVKSMVSDLSMPLRLSHIDPYRVYLTECSSTHEAVISLLLDDKSTDLADVRAELGLLDDGFIRAYVTLYDYESVLSSIGYMDQQGYMVMQSPDLMITHTESRISEEWWDRLNLLEPIPASLISYTFVSGGQAAVDTFTSVPSEANEASDSAGLRWATPGYEMALLDDLAAANAAATKSRPASVASAGASASAIEPVLNIMLQGDQKRTKGVPCLAGLSGVAKSAIVKGVARKNGWRMVDFRAAFLHRLDMEGLQYLADEENNNFYTYQDHTVYQKFSRAAYFGEFVKCSDQYIEYAKNMVMRLNAIKSAPPESDLFPIKESMQDKGTLSELDTAIAHYENESKPVVLFFDEIIRAPQKILNLFTIMLDSKQLGPLRFNNTKMCAAINTPHGMTLIADGVDLFVGQEDSVTDAAILERLKIIEVTPAMVYPGWLDYIKEQGWDQDVIDFVTDGGVDRAYGMDVLNNQELTIDQKRESVYPTFRAWENVSKILAAGRRSVRPVPIFKAQIVGVLGPGHGNIFVEYLISRGFEFATESDAGYSEADQMGSVLDSNLEIGQPTGLFGPSGFGKTARVNRLAEEKGYDVLTIQLSQKSLGDIMGSPNLVNIETFLTGSLGGVLSPEAADAVREVATEVKRDITGLPSMITQRAKDGAILDRIRQIRQKRAAIAATNQGRPPEDQLPLPKLVLFFDEVNRVSEQNKSVKSALFDAISDHRFAGVNFDPDEICVVAAANVNWEEGDGESSQDRDDAELSAIFGDKKDYGGTQKMDAALLLRLCNIQKKRVDEYDARETREYILNPDNGFHPVIRDYFKKLTDREVLLLMKSVEYKSELGNVPSIRSFSSLSGCLATSVEDFTGAWFFPTAGIITEFNTNYLQNGVQNINYLRQQFVIDRWVCMKHADICIPGESVGSPNLPDFHETIKELMALPESDLAQYETLITNTCIEILNMEEQVRIMRKSVIEAFLGSATSTDASIQAAASAVPKVVTDLLDIFSEAGSNLEKITYDQIIDQPTADVWTAQVFRDEKLVDNLGDEFLPALQFHLDARAFDCVAYILSAGFRLSSPGVFVMVVEGIWERTGIPDYSVELAPYNNLVADAVKQSPTRTLHGRWDEVLQEHGIS